ncbi:MAG: SDR family NAD(P)-dependent oxidoreductase, partial [Verrucomicrobiota bacterium]
MPDPFSLSGKIVVQFGGTGLLGRALVHALAAAGATTIVASRNRTALDALAEQERVANHNVLIEEVDIGSEASLHALRDRLLAQHGRVDGIVFNAVARTMKGYGDKLASWEASMSTNATGFFSTVRTFGDAMATQKSGSIV